MPLVTAQTGARIQIDWEKLASGASERTEVTLDGSMLRSVARFLDSSDSDSRDVQKLLSGLQGVYIHSYRYERTHEYPAAELESIRQQLKAGNWGRIVQSLNHDAGENDEVYLKNISGGTDVSGIVVLAAEPKEFTVVEIAGKIDPKDLHKLDGALNFHHSSHKSGKGSEEDEN